MPKLHNTHPVSQYQPAANLKVTNLSTFTLLREALPADLLRYHHFGQRVWFTTPLQRRAEGIGCGSRFWWEPSGGLNEGLFAGIITGVRTLSTGGYEDEGRDYVPEATFPVYLITFSPYRNPLYVLPWHIWRDRTHYDIDHSAALNSYQHRAAAKHFGSL